MLFVGRLDDRVKRVGLLIDAFAKVALQFPDAELVVVGDGNDAARLRKQAAKHVEATIRFIAWIAFALSYHFKSFD